jgi:hypothetical protein
MMDERWMDGQSSVDELWMNCESMFNQERMNDG